MGTTPGGLPYPDPSDLVAQGAAAIQALAEQLDPVAFSATQNADISIGNGGWTDVTAWTESEDTRGALDAGGVFTAPVRGIYTFAASVFWQTNAAGARYLAFWEALDGVNWAEIPGSALPANAVVDTRQNVCTILELPAGGKVKVRVFQNSGAALNLAKIGVNYPVFGGALLARTAS